MVYVVLLLIVAVVLIMSEVIMGDRALRAYAARLRALAFRAAESEKRLGQKISECKLLTEQLNNKTAECNLLRQHLDRLEAEVVSFRQQVQVPLESPEPLPEIHIKETPNLLDRTESIEDLQERVQTVEELIDFWRKTVNSRSA